MITRTKYDCLKRIQNGQGISCAGDQRKLMSLERLSELSNGGKRFVTFQSYIIEFSIRNQVKIADWKVSDDWAKIGFKQEKQRYSINTSINYIILHIIYKTYTRYHKKKVVMDKFYFKFLRLKDNLYGDFRLFKLVKILILMLLKFSYMKISFFDIMKHIYGINYSVYNRFIWFNKNEFSKTSKLIFVPP